MFAVLSAPEGRPRRSVDWPEESTSLQRPQADCAALLVMALRSMTVILPAFRRSFATFFAHRTNSA